MNDFPSPRAKADNSRRNAMAMGMGMLVLLAAVILVLLRLIPLTASGEISNWNARKLMRQADTLLRTAERVHDATPLFASAEGIYRQIARGPAIKPAYRIKAALALDTLSGRLPEQLGDIRDTLRMLNTQLKSTSDRAKLAPHVQAVEAAWRRQNPHGEKPVATNPAMPPAAPYDVPPPTPPKTTKSAGQVIAHIGGEEVTNDEVLYAWQALNGDAQPTTATQRLFVFKYLNMNLLAEEARRRGLEKDPRTALDLKINRLGALCDALDRDLAARLPKLSDKQMQDYYAAHRAEYSAAAKQAGIPDDYEHAAGAVQAGMEREALAKARGTLLQKLRAPQLPDRAKLDPRATPLPMPEPGESKTGVQAP